MLAQQISSVLILYVIASTNSQSCTPADSDAQCISKTTFRLCVNGKQIGPMHSCPPQTHCVDDKVPLCQLDIFSSAPVQRSVPNITFCETKISHDELRERCIEHISEYIMVPNSGCTMFVTCNSTSFNLFQCPSGTFFNGQVCLRDYKCPQPCIPIRYVDIRANIQKSKEILLNNGLKRWPIKNTSCKAFVELILMEDSTHRAVEKKCPHDTWYDPNVGLCRYAYFCEDEPHTARRCENGERQYFCDPEFHVPKCRFEPYIGPQTVPRSGCHYYRLCHKYPLEVRKCPPGTLFSEEDGMCVRGYKCPIPCIIKDHEDVTNVISYPDCVNRDYSYRGPVKNSRCRMYFECMPHNMSIVLKRCPFNLFYDAEKSKCLPGYKCPEYACVPLDMEDGVNRLTDEIDKQLLKPGMGGIAGADSSLEAAEKTATVLGRAAFGRQASIAKDAGAAGVRIGDGVTSSRERPTEKGLLASEILAAGKRIAHIEEIAGSLPSEDTSLLSKAGLTRGGLGSLQKNLEREDLASGVAPRKGIGKGVLVSDVAPRKGLDDGLIGVAPRKITDRGHPLLTDEAERVVGLTSPEKRMRMHEENTFHNHFLSIFLKNNSSLSLLKSKT